MLKGKTVELRVYNELSHTIQWTVFNTLSPVARVVADGRQCKASYTLATKSTSIRSI